MAVDKSQHIPLEGKDQLEFTVNTPGFWLHISD